MPNYDLFSSIPVSGPGQSIYDPYNMCTDDEYFIPANTVEGTHEYSYCAVHLLTATTLYLNSVPKIPENWGYINPNLNDYYTNLMEIHRVFRILDVTDWWQ